MHVYLGKGNEMAESRLGAKAVYPAEYETDPGFIKMIKESTMHKLGLAIIENIISKENPTVVRLIEKTIPNYGWFSNNQLSYEIIADLSEVEMMHVRMAELPPFEFASRGIENKVIIEWQCGYCGQINIIEEHLECRKCGAPRKAMR